MVLVLASPVVRGRVPFPTDILAWQAPWAGRVAQPPTLPDYTRVDSLVQYAASSLPYVEALHEGRIELWDPNTFLGYPLHAGSASLVAPFFPTTLGFGRVFPARTAIVLQLLFLLWMMGVAMAGFLRDAGLHPWAAVMGAAVWQCAVSVHSWFGMQVFMIGLWGIPALCWIAGRMVRNPGPGIAGTMGIVLALLLLAQSPNPLVFAVCVATAWGTVALLVRPPTLPHFRRVVTWTLVGTGLGAFLGAAGWLPMLELLGQVQRSVHMPWPTLYATRMPVAGLLLPLLPEYFGGTWSARSFLSVSLPEIAWGVGAAGLLMAAAAWGHPRRHLVRFAGSLCLFGVLLALGTPLARLTAALPAFGTSVLPRSLQLSEWALAVLAAAGMDRLLREQSLRRARGILLRAGLLAGGIAGAIAIGPYLVSQLPIVRRPIDPAALAAHFSWWAPWWRPTWIALGVVVAGAGGGVAFRRPRWIVVALALALVVERRWDTAHATPWHAADSLYPPVPELDTLASTTPPVRTLNPGGFPNTLKPLRIASPEGYNPFILRSYLDLLDLGFPDHHFRGYHLLSVPARESPVLHLLGIGALLDANGAAVPPAPFVRRSGPPGVAWNPRAWPRALLIPEAVAVDSNAAASAMLAAAPHVWRTRAVVVGTVPSGPRGGRGTARVTRYEADAVTIETDADGPSWLLLSDQHYPGWTATVDGAAAPILRAYLALRLVPVPEGRHAVEFHFRPPVLHRALQLTGLGACGLGLLGMLAIVGWLRPQPARSGHRTRA